MNTTVTIESTDQIISLLDTLEHAPVQAIQTVMSAVDAGSQLLLSTALRGRFSGQGPYPVASRRLGVKTGLLRRSLRFTRPALVGNGTIRVLAGSNLPYFAAHEFGFKGRVKVKETSVRAYTVRNAFGTGNSFSVRAHTRKAHIKELNIPRRAPLTAAIEEHSTRIYVRQITRALTNLINNHPN